MEAEKKQQPDLLQQAAEALLARVRQVLEDSPELDIKSMRELASVLKDMKSLRNEEEDAGITVSLSREVAEYSD